MSREMNNLVSRNLSRVSVIFDTSGKNSGTSPRLILLYDLVIIRWVKDFTYETMVRNESSRVFISTNRPKDSDTPQRNTTTYTYSVEPTHNSARCNVACRNTRHETRIIIGAEIHACNDVHIARRSIIKKTNKNDERVT